MIKLPSPDYCKHCGRRGKVIDSRAKEEDGVFFRRRRHFCEPCGWRWNSYQTVLDPRRITIIKRPEHNI